MIARILLSLTPTTVLIALIVTWTQKVEGQEFNLLDALRGNKADKDNKLKVKPPEKPLSNTADEIEIERKELLKMDLLSPKEIKDNVKSLLSPIPPSDELSSVKVETATSPPALKPPTLKQLPYFGAYNAGMVNGKSIAIFLVRTTDPKVVSQMNQAVVGFEAIKFRRFLNIAVLGPDNPNMSHFPIKDENIEMVAFYKRPNNPTWQTNNYKGEYQINAICKKMQDWLERKATYQNWQDKRQAVPRTFKLIPSYPGSPIMVR